eukprot:jgi/Psemu1/43207/gm1.43207_g
MTCHPAFIPASMGGNDYKYCGINLGSPCIVLDANLNNEDDDDDQNKKIRIDTILQHINHGPTRCIKGIDPEPNFQSTAANWWKIPESKPRGNTAPTPPAAALPPPMESEDSPVSTRTS